MGVVLNLKPGRLLGVGPGPESSSTSSASVVVFGLACLFRLETEGVFCESSKLLLRAVFALLFLDDLRGFDKPETGIVVVATGSSKLIWVKQG